METWYKLHLGAMTCTTRPQFQVLFSDCVNAQRCEKCVQHANTYVRAHPDLGTTPKSFFEYTVAYHNSVNQILGKPLVSNQQALKFISAPRHQVATGGIQQGLTNILFNALASMGRGSDTYSIPHGKSCSSCG
jgi:hypothetical protein